MKRSAALKDVSLLLRYGIDMFHNFQCNHSAGKVIRERLALVAWIFGDPYYGLVPFSEAESISNGLVPFSESSLKLNGLLPFRESASKPVTESTVNLFPKDKVF